MSFLSVIDCIQKYALPDQQDQARLQSRYPYPEADGSELRIALKNAALNCDEKATEVLLDQLKHGMFGQSREDREARIASIKEAKKEIKKIDSLDSRFDTVLKDLTDTKKYLVGRIGLTITIVPPPLNPKHESRDLQRLNMYRRQKYLRMAFDGKSCC